MGTLASQAEIGVWVQAPAGLALPVHGWWWLWEKVAHSRCGSLGLSPQKKIEIVCEKSYNLVHIWPQCRP